MKEERGTIIKAIITPLGFFALSLLIVEGFMGIILVFSKGNQSKDFYFLGMIIGAILFILVVILVWLLVWYKPENIVKAGKDYVEIEKIKARNNKITLLKERDENRTKNVKSYNYYDEYTPEEIDAAGDAWIQNQIDQERGK